VIFNAIIIILLIPLALRGVKFRPASAADHPAPQSADLRRGRHHLPLPRHQADRPVTLQRKEEVPLKTFQDAPGKSKRHRAGRRIPASSSRLRRSRLLPAPS
jgi:hypothetical protein